MIWDVLLDTFGWLLGPEALEVLALCGVALALGAARWVWLARRTLSRDAVLSRTTFSRPAYALTVGAGRARLDMHAAPLTAAAAAAGLLLLGRHGTIAAIAAVHGQASPVPLALAVLGAFLTWMALPLMATRMTLLVRPGSLRFELARLGRRTDRWEVTPLRIWFDLLDGRPRMWTEYVLGQGVPGPLLFDAGLTDPTERLMHDLTVAAEQLTAVATSARSPGQDR